MKKHFKYSSFIVAIIGVLAFGLVSCNDNEKDIDTTPPGKLSVKDVIPTNGGAKITYTLPDDDDVLFVKAKYTNSLGNEVYKVSSIYNDTIELDGFSDTVAHPVDLFVVDKHNNHSEATATSVTPLISYIYLVQKSIVVTPDLGGVKVEWDNVSAKTVHVYLTVMNETFEDSIIFSSYLSHYTVFLRGLDSVNYDFYAKVEDFPGNKTSQVYIASAKPKFEQKIEKDTWTLVSNLSADGNAWEGETVNFWDDIIDTPENPDDNSYFMINRDDNGGALNYPMDFVIDFNKNVVVNRFVVWQRAFDYENRTADNISEEYYYYKSENLRMFDIFFSNDLVEWTKAGSFDIGDPKDDDGNVPAEATQEGIEGHMFLLDNATDPFRYMKFSITSNFGSEIYINGSEITLFGLDNVE